MKKAVVGIILVVIIFIGAFVYFVSGVSGASAPIKKYWYSGNIGQLIAGLRKYTSNSPDMTFKVTDTVGWPAEGYAIYMNIKTMYDGHHIEYSLECEKNNDNGDPNTTKIELVVAYDATTLTGGYRDKAAGIRAIIKNFDENFLVGLQKSQNIKLTVIKPTFPDPLKHAWNGE
jgi:hypothetical protein